MNSGRHLNRMSSQFPLNGTQIPCQVSASEARVNRFVTCSSSARPLVGLCGGADRVPLFTFKSEK